jgi:hypothetical protein
MSDAARAEVARHRRALRPMFDLDGDPCRRMVHAACAAALRARQLDDEPGIRRALERPYRKPTTLRLVLVDPGGLPTHALAWPTAAGRHSVEAFRKLATSAVEEAAMQAEFVAWWDAATPRGLLEVLLALDRRAYLAALLACVRSTASPGVLARVPEIQVLSDAILASPTRSGYAATMATARWTLAVANQRKPTLPAYVVVVLGEITDAARDSCLLSKVVAARDVCRRTWLGGDVGAHRARLADRIRGTIAAPTVATLVRAYDSLVDVGGYGQVWTTHGYAEDVTRPSVPAEVRW